MAKLKFVAPLVMAGAAADGDRRGTDCSRRVLCRGDGHIEHHHSREPRR